MLVRSSASARSAVRRAQNAYTARPWRSNSTPNASGSARASLQSSRSLRESIPISVRSRGRVPSVIPCHRHHRRTGANEGMRVALGGLVRYEQSRRHPARRQCCRRRNLSHAHRLTPAWLPPRPALAPSLPRLRMRKCLKEWRDHDPLQHRKESSCMVMRVHGRGDRLLDRDWGRACLAKEFNAVSCGEERGSLFCEPAAERRKGDAVGWEPARRGLLTLRPVARTEVAG